MSVPYDAVSADVQHIAHSITLDSIVLTADGFTLHEERPYTQQRLWNGNWYEIPQGRKNCRLQLQCRAAAALRDALLPVLRAALNDQTAYAFTLGGTAFSAMKLTGYKLHTEDSAAFCHMVLEFIGVAGEPAAEA